MLRVLALSLAILLQLDLRSAADDFDLGAVIQIAAFDALQPRHFAIFFSHDNTKNCQWSVVRRPLLMHDNRHN
jgi:hypothetical protein